MESKKKLAEEFEMKDLGNNALTQGLLSKILQRASSYSSTICFSFLVRNRSSTYNNTNDRFVFYNLEVKVRIGFTLGKSHAHQENIYSSIPSSGSLLQAIEGLLQLAYVSPSVFNFKSL